MKNEKTLDNSIQKLICYNFYTGWRELDQLFKEVVDESMTMQKFFILSFLYDERKTMSDISKHLQLDSSAVSTLVDRMFKKGLVTRHRDEDDRRLVYAEITKEAKEIKNVLQPKVDTFMATVSDGISEEEQNLLKDIVNRIKVNHKAKNDLAAEAV